MDSRMKSEFKENGEEEAQEGDARGGDEIDTNITTEGLEEARWRRQARCARRAQPYAAKEKFCKARTRQYSPRRR